MASPLVHKTVRPHAAQRFGPTEIHAATGNVRTSCMQPRLILNATEFSSLWTIKTSPQQPYVHVGWWTVAVLLHVWQFLKVTDEAGICETYFQNGNKGILQIDLTMIFAVCILNQELSGRYHPGTCHRIDMMHGLAWRQRHQNFWSASPKRSEHEKPWGK